MNSLVSIILPAFNVGKYIGTCLDSVVHQSYSNIEVIIVDDGSNDNTALICKKYVQCDQRVRYFFQENQGSGPARNRGLKEASGEYVMFVDPDDWVSTDIVSFLLNRISNTGADLVCCSFTDVIYKDGVELRRIIRNSKAECLVGEWNCRANYSRLLAAEVLAPPTRKLFKMEIIRKHDITFPALRRSQDIPFNYRYFSHVRKCEVLPDSLYFYRVAEQDGYVTKLKPDYFLTIDLLYTELVSMHHQWGFDEKSKQVAILNCYFENLVMLSIEANVINRSDVEPILRDETVNYIVNRSSPDKLFNCLMKKAFLRNSVTHLKVLVRIRIVLRMLKRKLGK